MIASATAHANTASSQKSALMRRRAGSRAAAFAAGFETAHRFEAVGERGQFEGERRGTELLELRGKSRRGLGPDIEIAAHPTLRDAQVFAKPGLVAHRQREARVQEAQLEVLAQEVRL